MFLFLISVQFRKGNIKKDALKAQFNDSQNQAFWISLFYDGLIPLLKLKNKVRWIWYDSYDTLSNWI